MKGVYCLLIRLKEDSRLSIGSLGVLDFKAGYYVYVGSAMNSLKSRIKRHLRKGKKIFWHIDYLLEKAHVVDVFYGETNKRVECSLAEEISGHLNSIKKFGSSDCRCISHLFYSPKRVEAEKSIVSALKNNDLKPERYNEVHI